MKVRIIAVLAAAALYGALSGFTGAGAKQAVAKTVQTRAAQIEEATK